MCQDNQEEATYQELWQGPETMIQA
jgi:hypothetical protein